MESEMGRLGDKIAIVTGAARGNGEGAAMKSGIGCLKLIPPPLYFSLVTTKAIGRSSYFS